MKSILPTHQSSVQSLAILTTLLLAITCSIQSTYAQTSSLPNTRTLEKVQLASISKTHTFRKIFLSSQPSKEDFVKLQKAGIKTVVNLRKTEENTALDEKKVVTELGMKYIHLPWKETDELTNQVFDDARKALNTETRPMLIHCGSASRVGAIWIAWRVLDAGINIDEAVKEAKAIGLTSEEFETRAKHYIMFYSLRTDC